MTFNTLLFVCAICERDVRDHPDRNPRDAHLPPICKGCERHYPDVRRLPQGAMMDRRMALRLSAIANALNGAANVMEWEARYGR